MVTRRKDATFLVAQPMVTDSPQRRALAKRRKDVAKLSDEQVSRVFAALPPAEQQRLLAASRGPGDAGEKGSKKEAKDKK